MTVGLLTLELYLSDTDSLKMKRSLIAPIVQRVRTRFNVSVCEAEAQDVLSRGVIAVACVGVSDRHVQSQLQAVLNYVLAHHPDVDVLDSHLELVA